MARATRRSVVIVASRFHAAVTQALAAGAVEALRDAGIAPARIRTQWVAGAFELPVAAAVIAAQARPDAIVALGCLIQGQTPQYAAIGGAVAQGLMSVAVQTKIPIGFGVIIADSMSQARQRAGGVFGNRGREAAEAVLEVLALKHQPRSITRR